MRFQIEERILSIIVHNSTRSNSFQSNNNNRNGPATSASTTTPTDIV